MAHSLIGAGRAVHLKIVCLALVGSIAVMLVGINARGPEMPGAGAQRLTDGPVIKAGRPLAYTARDTPAAVR